MRLQNREVTDKERIKEILNQCETARIAFSSNNAPYIVPVCYGFEISSGKIDFYFHCAFEGKKLDMLRKNNSVCVETDIQYKITSEEDKNFACGYSCDYASVIAFGKAFEVSEAAEKEKGLKLIMRQYTGRDFDFNEKMLASVNIVKIECTEFTAKQHI